MAYPSCFYSFFAVPHPKYQENRTMFDTDIRFYMFDVKKCIEYFINISWSDLIYVFLLLGTFVFYIVINNDIFISHMQTGQRIDLLLYR